MNEQSSGLHDLDLGGKRLEKRADRILKALLKSPQSSIPKACQPWSGTLATYRFFWNEAVSHEALITPHYEATEDRTRPCVFHRIVCP